MDNKHELTEQLKVVETEVYNNKVDLLGVTRKLKIAQQYEEDLIKRQQFARKQTEDLRNQFFQKCTAISQGYDKMKKIVDVFTGNFYNQDLKP